MPGEMTDSSCPYFTCEKTAFRGNLDLTEAAPVSIVVTWHCKHPFHGMPLELGDARGEVEEQCAAFPLPRQQPDGGAPSAPEDQPDGTHGGPEQGLGEQADREHAGRG